MTPTMITLNNLTYYYNTRPALSNITTEIPTGIHLLLGENGAGKTTLLHVIAGLRLPENPEQCLIDGISPSLRQPSLMSRIFIVSDDMTIPFPTIEETVRRHACFYPSFDYDMLRRNLEVFGMSERDNITAFSLGNRKKAMIAYALALRPEVLLLDEPANGLDISSKQSALSLMSECIDETQTVILSTHTVSDFMPLFDSVMLLSAGRLLINMPVWQIVECIDFVSDTYPPEGALFIDQSFGRFRAILPHRPSTETTDIDFVMLYNALQNVTSRHNILQLLTAQTQ